VNNRGVLSPILTVDVEEWFHVCGEPGYSDPTTWDARVKRVHHGIDVILETLAATSSRGTFFVLGWITRKSPALVRRISEAGHEIGCHGDLHRRVFEMTVGEFRDDVRRSKRTIEDATGAPVTAFRAPEWSMRTPANPALAVLVEEGFTLDSSLVAAPPVGIPTNPTRPLYLDTPAGPILEVPPLQGSFFFRPAMLGGGVCSRMSRFSRVDQAMDASLAAGVPPVLYCHPWEFDDDHPAMKLSPLGRLVHFGGRRRTLPRLKRHLARRVFRPISSAREAVASPA